MNKEQILNYLKEVKNKYEKDGFLIIGLFGSYASDSQNDKSDIDILYELKYSFVEKYGFNSVEKIEQIKESLEKDLGKKIDMASFSGMENIVQKHISNKAIYV